MSVTIKDIARRARVVHNFLGVEMDLTLVKLLAIRDSGQPKQTPE
jgi:hypothetical protein